MTNKPTGIKNQLEAEFKEMLTEEWKNFDSDRCDTIVSKGELETILSEKASEMLADYERISKESPASNTQENMLFVVYAKHTPNVLRVQRIASLDSSIDTIIDIERYRVLGHEVDEDLIEFGKSLKPQIIASADDHYRVLIQQKNLGSISEFDAFVSFYLELRMLLFKSSPRLSAAVKASIQKWTPDALNFDKCVDFYLSLNSVVRDQIVDQKHREFHNYELFLNRYNGHLETKEERASTTAPNAEDSQKRSESQSDKEAILNRIIEVSHKKVLTLRDKYKYRDVTHEQLRDFIDQTRKKNGKHNYTQIGKKLGLSRDTAKSRVKDMGLKNH